MLLELKLFYQVFPILIMFKAYPQTEKTILKILIFYALGIVNHKKLWKVSGCECYSSVFEA